MLDKEDMLWQVTLGNAHVFVVARDRAGAVDQVRNWFGDEYDRCTVTNLTVPGDRIRVAINLFL